MIIDGKKESRAIKDAIGAFITENHICPALAIVQVGDDAASSLYIRNKEKAAAGLGIMTENVKLAAGVGTDELEGVIRGLNSRGDINGIIVQMPLPGHIDKGRVILAVDPRKDVDGFHPANLGMLAAGMAAFVSCTPLGYCAS